MERRRGRKRKRERAKERGRSEEKNEKENEKKKEEAQKAPLTEMTRNGTRPLQWLSWVPNRSRLRRNREILSHPRSPRKPSFVHRFSKGSESGGKRSSPWNPADSYESTTRSRLHRLELAPRKWAPLATASCCGLCPRLLVRRCFGDCCWSLSTWEWKSVMLCRHQSPKELSNRSGALRKKANSKIYFLWKKNIVFNLTVLLVTSGLHLS